MRRLRPRRAWLRPTSLRARLVLGVLVLAAIGLAVADVIGVQVLRHSQLNRIDQELHGLDGRGRSPFAGAHRDGATLLDVVCRPRTTGTTGSRRGPDTFFEACLSPTGAVVLNGSQNSTLAPAVLPHLTLAEATARSGQAMTVRSTTGSSQWRIVATPLADRSGTLIVGQSLRELRSTTDQLLLIDIAVSGAVLLALTGFAYGVVRIGMRPLDAVTRTADGIAAGDLSLRAPVADARSEVGRLGTAFNSMLEQIQRAFRDRERSTSRLRQFAADASHELRTPLTSIRGFAELYRQGAVTPGPDLDRVMGRIEDEAVRMGSLVHDLLQLARLDQGPLPDLRDVDLTKVADDAVHDALAIEPDRPIRVQSAGPVLVRGDDGQLRQIATNLLGNARTHTPAGTPVDVRAYVDGTHAVLEVADAGPGLDAEAAARVFDRFWRADPSRTREDGGSGLGLAIVAAIAGLHDGTAEVESQPGAGALFRVRLPLRGAAGARR
ncbi:MAG TPA: HAMP domain-containing sensor histidine kinase [Mycobacteriales bacterium]